MPKQDRPNLGAIAVGLGIAGILAAMSWQIWFGSRPSAATTQLPERAADDESATVDSVVVEKDGDESQRGNAAVSAPLETAPVVMPEVDISGPPDLHVWGGKLGWEAQIDAVLSASLTETAKAEQLLRQLSSLPDEALTRAAQEAVDRLPDGDYSRIALPVLLNTRTHGAAEVVLFADLLERPDAITLPALLAIARRADHPLAQSAHETLALLVGQENGSDWKKWEESVDKAVSSER